MTTSRELIMYPKVQPMERSRLVPGGLYVGIAGELIWCWAQFQNAQGSMVSWLSVQGPDDGATRYLVLPLGEDLEARRLE